MIMEIVFWQMLTLFVIIVVGLICGRTRVLTESETKGISGLIINVFNPALVFSSVINNRGRVQDNMLQSITLIAIAMFAGLILIGIITAGLFSKERDEQIMYKLMLAFPNVGYIGIPLINSIYGPSATIYVAIFILLFNIVIYTYGIALLKGKTGKRFSSENLKSILNMGTISCLVTLLFFIFGIPVPEIVKTPITYLGNCATPLALMSVGFSLANAKFPDVFLDKRLYLFSAFKLLFLPAIGVLLLKLFSLPEQVIGISAIMFAMPTGNLPVILANRYDVNSDICSSAIIITTLLSVLTIPLIAGLI